MDRLAKVRAAVAELVAADPGQWTLEELGQAIAVQRAPPTPMPA